MPFNTPGVAQVKAISVTAGTSVSFSMTSSLGAGNAILLIGGLVESSSSQTLFIDAPTGSGTWTTPVSARDSTPNDYAPNLVVALLANVSSGASPTWTIPVKRWNGSSFVTQSSNIKFEGVAIELNNVPTSAVIDVVRFATTGSGATQTTTPTTPDLSQDTNRLIAGAAGWFYDPENPTTGGTWTEHASVINGDASRLGFQASSRALTGTDDGQFVVMPHPNGGSGGSGQCGVIVVIKGSQTVVYNYEVEIPSAIFSTSITNLRATFWRNVNWWTAVPEVYDIASPSIAAKSGDPNTNILTVQAPAGALLTDTVTACIEESSGTGYTTGHGGATVVEP